MARSFNRFLIFLLMLARAAMPLSAGAQPPHGSRVAKGHTDKPSPEEVDRAIALATSYLERACRPDGKFVYLVNVASGRESASYDIIRHAGAMYGLAMANRSRPDPHVAKAMLRAATFMRQNYIGPGARLDQLAAWSKPLNDRAPSKGNYAELGGTGLGLVALAAVRQVEPKVVPLGDLQSLGRFLLFLQKDDGRFIHAYTQQGGPSSRREVLYYPGEAALGLISLYENDHSTQWLIAAAKALSFLAKSRARMTPVPADHWALIATAALMPYADQVRSVVSREELVQHAEQICDSIVHEQFRGSAAVGIDGAFDPTGRTAPAAARLEGCTELGRRLLALAGATARLDSAAPARRLSGLCWFRAGPHPGGRQRQTPRYRARLAVATQRCCPKGFGCARTRSRNGGHVHSRSPARHPR